MQLCATHELYSNLNLRNVEAKKALALGTPFGSLRWEFIAAV
jgi:hypothetical protein